MLKGYKVISVCTSQVNVARSFNYIQALNNCFKDKNYKLFVYQTCSDLFWNKPNEDGEMQIYELIDYDVTDVVIVLYDIIKNKSVIDKICDKAKKHNKPIIIIDGIVEGCINVYFDYTRGFETLVRHVIEYHKLTDVHFMAGIKGNNFSEERLEVFKKVIKENNIPFDEANVSYGDFWSRPTQLATEIIIKENRVPKAFICANDIMAITVCNVLQQNGYSVPDDVVVTGFDGIDEVKYSKPCITTCECSFSDLAKKVTSILDDIFNKNILLDNYIINYNVLYSESCGCSKSKSFNAATMLNTINDRFTKYQNNERELYELSYQIPHCSSLREVSKALHKFDFYNMCCLLNSHCLDETVDPSVVKSVKPFSDKLCLFFKANDDRDYFTTEFDIKNIVPDLEYILEHDFPFVFTTINDVNNVLGYICYCFDCDMDDYCKVSQFTNAINSSIIGYRNLRYQQYINKKIEDAYKYDALTKLYNRNGFNRVIQNINETLEKDPDSRLVIASIDLDGLKFINDNFGHEEGDNAILQVANAIRQSFPEEKICCRFGGDELLSVSITKYNDNISEKIKDSITSYINNYNKTSNKPYEISASIGIKISSTNQVDFAELLKESDKLMYQDKALKKIR